MPRSYILEMTSDEVDAIIDNLADYKERYAEENKLSLVEDLINSMVSYSCGCEVTISIVGEEYDLIIAAMEQHMKNLEGKKCEWCCADVLEKLRKLVAIDSDTQTDRV